MSDSKGNGAPPAPVETAENGAAPPAYTAVGDAPPPTGPPKQLSPDELAQLNSAFASLSLPAVAFKLEPDTCLAHLKLLFAFHGLKEDIGYTDGLWEIFNSRADRANGEAEKKDSDPGSVLAQLREKRWAIYIARAVDRYEAWWNTFPSNPLVTTDFSSPSPKYSQFTEGNTAKTWTPKMLPPLGLYPRTQYEQSSFG
jgi:hypothetical protein